MESLTAYNQRNKSQTALFLKGLKLEREENAKLQKSQRAQFVQKLKDHYSEGQKKFKQETLTALAEHKKQRQAEYQELKSYMESLMDTCQKFKAALQKEQQERLKLVKHHKNATLQQLIDCVEKHREESTKAFGKRMEFINQLRQDTQKLLSAYESDRKNLRTMLWDKTSAKG